MINKFEGRWGFLSNFYPCQIEHKGITYPSLEHYYVALKITEMQFIDGSYYTASDLREIISKIPSPSEVKKLGRKLKVRTDWDDKKLDFMKWGVKEKFKNEKLADLLLSTGDSELIEGNWWHDNFYGKCFCPKCNGSGENHLGKILMNIREELRNKTKHTF
jgi:ribA/ribD-fused uncharacterized protein